jgi:hypothetical protein
VTRWGLVLLVGFLVLGLGSYERRRAFGYALSLTVVVLIYVGLKDGLI